MVASPPPPPMELASATFVHLGCSHTQLFRSEYKRSNRTKGLKILRCFPHCCPEHIDRSYCGTSLSVRVELAARSPGAAPVGLPPSDALAVFARFEAVIDVSIRPGECVEVAKIAAGAQSDSNLDGQWIEGLIDRPSGLVTTFRRPGAQVDYQKPLVFHLNGKPLSRWYYDWESGANKAQRLMKHVLKAYVVERCAVDRHGNLTAFTDPQARTQLYRVLHVVTSPEFTVISYRRAPAEQYRAALVPVHPLQALQAGGMETYPDDAYHKRVHSYSDVDSYDGRIDPVIVKTEPTYEVKLERVSGFPYPSEALGLFEGNLQWRQTNLPAARVSRNLALAYAFLRWVPMGNYVPIADELVQMINHHLQRTFQEFPDHVNQINCFTSFLLDEAGGMVKLEICEGDGSAKPLQSKLKALLHVLIQGITWFYSEETWHWMRNFFCQHARSVLDKHALRACFLLFIQELNDRLDAQVFARTDLKSLDNVAEEVIAAVYAYPEFHARRFQVREILGGRNFVGWNAFVGQMRETHIGMPTSRGIPYALTRRPLRIDFSRMHPPRNSIENCWNGEWLLHVNEASWRSSERAERGNNTNGERSSTDSVYSLLTVFQVISRMARLHVALGIEACELHVRSNQTIAGSLNCMRIVLDGKKRVFSQFPDGMASAVDAGVYGDYVGEVRVEHSERFVAYLQVYNWSVSRNDPSFNVRSRIECWRGHSLCISGDVLATTAPTSYMTKEEASLWQEMPLQTKKETVSEIHARYLQEHSRARWETAVAAEPWKEVGRFRLAYVKA